ncbi:MAG TPA: arsenate reductase (glutaredoxin) [Hellea balneolensis]|uniref:Arsenate reductase n=1 Tax=Hellea balneolensis TaxID=287478 RepID=A0A7C5R7X5_9PROT|nr:arsenate reductase (glutaredoxin) [Hellea balneolensis]
MSVKILHNPRCSKSRQTLALLSENGVQPEIIEYLKQAPSADEIKEIAKMLGVKSVREMMRTGEAIYKELNLAAVDDESRLIRAMVENPKLIERPIVINGTKAAIGRPPESVLSIL